jgi:hypothetical protein
MRHGSAPVAAMTPGRSWLQVAVVASVVLACGAIVIVGGTTIFVYRHIRAEFVPAETAEQRIAAARARFGSSQAFLRVDADRGPVVNGREDTGASHEALSTLRALAYDPTAGKLVDISIPFWLLRLVPNGRISLDASSGIDFSAKQLHLNVSALEDLGPGLVIDQQDRGGTKVLVWTESLARGTKP